MNCPDCGRPSRVRLDESGDVCPVAYARETNFSIIHAEANCLRAQLRAEHAAHAETKRERDEYQSKRDAVARFMGDALRREQGEAAGALVEAMRERDTALARAEAAEKRLDELIEIADRQRADFSADNLGGYAYAVSVAVNKMRTALAAPTKPGNA